MERFKTDTGITNRNTRYDYILAPPDMLPALQSCHVVANHPAIPNASDHFPITAEFTLT